MAIFLFVLAVLILLVGSFFLQGLRYIPANPPHKAQITSWGRRVPGRSKDEGWRFFPLYPYWHGYVLVKVERITFEIVSGRTRTPDRAESRIPVQVTIRPVPELLTAYLDSGGEEGVKAQITGKLLERIREWAMDPEGGPADWIELNQSALEAVSVLLKKVAANSVAPIPEYAQGVPTWVWLRFYARPQPRKLLQNEEEWGANDWEKVRGVLASIETTHGPKAVSDLEAAVQKRRKEVESVRTGSGTIKLDDLGVVLERLNVGDIDVLGKVGETAEQAAKEEMERKAERIEIENISSLIAFIQETHNCSFEEAKELLQTERNKVRKEITERKISLAPSVKEALDSALPGLLAQIFRKGN